jgi:hypothetical protein
MFTWSDYRIVAGFSRTALRHFWWVKWQGDRFLSETFEFLLSVLCYRVVNLKEAHSLAVCCYIRKMAHARTVVISLISPLLSACVRAKGVLLIKMALSVPECAAFVEMTFAYFHQATLCKCWMFFLIIVPWMLCRIVLIVDCVVK